MKNILFVLSTCILLASCHQQKMADESLQLADMAYEEETVPITRQAMEVPEPPLPAVKNNPVVKKKIIKDGRVGIEVEELDKSKAQVDSLVKMFNAYYANESLNNTHWETSYALTIRIPSKYFEHFILGIEKGGGKILFKEIDARDVTDQFIDLETRLTNKKSYLKRYKELLKKANTVKEILQIEEKIRGLEEEIESTMGRLKYLSDQVSYSTLNLSISKPKPEEYQSPKRTQFYKRIKIALSKGWYGFMDFVVFCVNIWPFCVIVGIIIYAWRRYRRKRRAKKA
ncbi:DUF4349 domain-containing protein [Labilibacter marinus]|uniref:DUF4349 domain-containing protein n=1 Tax=Labilibacter marinus TaxID=1477105 RepID=UPI00094FC04F|nr:DUF4349 domain-containing protein [Labilibacter marinus]